MKYTPIICSMLLGVSFYGNAQHSGKKNILFIAVDDLKPVLGCYGDPHVISPNIDKLASQGVIFSRAYTQQAVSAASRASLLTGWRPDRTQVWDLKTLIRDKNPDVLTLPQHFKQEGYEVAGIGKIYDFRSVDKENDKVSWSVPYINHYHFQDGSNGYPVLHFYQDPQTRALAEKYTKEAEAKGKKGNEIIPYIWTKVKPSTECVDVPDNAYADGGIVDGAIDFLKKYKKDKPLFLAVGFHKPHLPFTAPKKYWDLYDRNSLPTATFKERAKNSPEYAYQRSEELQSYSDIPPVYTFSDIKNTVLTKEKERELIHGYYACASYIDAQIGKLLKALDEAGMRENTIVVLWGDHGWHLGDHGLWNKHTNFEQATSVPMIFYSPDIQGGQKIDSVTEFLDIFPTLCDLTGVDIPGDLDGVSLKPLMTHQKMKVKEYAVSQFPKGPRMGYSLRTEKYRYTIWLGWKNRNLDTEKVLAEELYDYDKDPNETVNVINEKDYRKAVSEMRAYWKEYVKTNQL